MASDHAFEPRCLDTDDCTSYLLYHPITIASHDKSTGYCLGVFCCINSPSFMALTLGQKLLPHFLILQMSVLFFKT